MKNSFENLFEQNYSFGQQLIRLTTFPIICPNSLSVGDCSSDGFFCGMTAQCPLTTRGMFDSLQPHIQTLINIDASSLFQPILISDLMLD